jgi:hypothetical protein
MATSRHFVDVSDADLARFSEENENENTRLKADFQSSHEAPRSSMRVHASN